MDIKNLSIVEKIGQMIMVGVNTNHITEREKILITKYKIGGFLLYRKNFKTYDEMLNIISELKKLNSSNKIPLFIAIDQEGGRVNRMPNEIKNLPSANKLSSLDDVNIVIDATKITSILLKSSGFNMDFSPVLDIKRFEDTHAVGDRCYGSNKDDVIKYAIPVMKEFQNNGIIPIIKHFPGHGATNIDSHLLLPIINSSILELEKEDIFPFTTAINNGADALLLGHLLIKNETGIYPVSLSRKFIVKYVRKKYRYRGLVVTDDLKMHSIRFIYGPITAVKKAFEAGNDIILFRFSNKEEKKALNKVLNLARSGKIKESQINRSVNRIIKIKEKYNLSDDNMPTRIDIDELNNKIQKIRNVVGLDV